MWASVRSRRWSAGWSRGGLLAPPRAARACRDSSIGPRGASSSGLRTIDDSSARRQAGPHHRGFERHRYETAKCFLGEGARVIGVGKDGGRLRARGRFSAHARRFRRGASGTCAKRGRPSASLPQCGSAGAPSTCSSTTRAIIVNSGNPQLFEEEPADGVERSLEQTNPRRGRIV